MNTRLVIIRKVGPWLVRFYCVLNGKLVDVTEWPICSEQDKFKAKNALGWYGIDARVPWNAINRHGDKPGIEWTYQGSPTSHWPSPQDEFVKNAEDWITVSAKELERLGAR